MTAEPFRIGEPFRPEPAYRTYMYISLFLIVAIVILPFVVLPAALSESLDAILIVAVPLAAVLVFVAAWIPLYYRSVLYELTPTEISWRRGVWFRQTGIVPYNRITNVDISQGPLMRYLGFSSLRVQTAGYSAQARAEINLSGIEDAEALREKIMGFVRGAPPVATEGQPEQRVPEAAAEGDVVGELRAIRQLLEKIAEK
ncbi:PH domain-containing protein [Methanoculleus sp. FWC-SCC1]|uniref:PH domain-containing protein n=1 Tax=Methanoculleus frigidifontis TaxID=2584085 RepID=A0ABT8MC66_9EURY|nr:PH domain-containing protein [Methanoculleus sp. FWC-SCC1]MDN7025530.1 PH domain-containing protein [Methanoculleus sp. FWC-SCC1]